MNSVDLKSEGDWVSPLESIQKMTAFISLLSAIAFLVGYNHEQSYFNWMGAPWVTTMLPLAKYGLGNFGIIILLFIFLYLSILFFSTDSNLKRYAERWWPAALTLSFACDGVVTALKNLLDLKVQFFFLYSVGIFELLVGTIIVGFIYCYYAENKDFKKFRFVSLAFGALSLIFTTAPRQLGRADALMDGSPVISTLPVVNILGQGGQTYRLVTYVEGNYLLLSWNELNNSHIFKLVAPKEIIAISGVRASQS